jgi:hypothetical protein
MESQFVSPKKFKFVFTKSENKYTFVDNMEQRCLHGKNKKLKMFLPTLEKSLVKSIFERGFLLFLNLKMVLRFYLNDNRISS